MKRFIVLDSAPLGLLTQRRGVAPADACRAWLASHSARGAWAVLPEIVDYEVRRELLRAGKTQSVVRLDRFITNPYVRYLPVTTGALRRAAHLWAEARRRGTPTADPHALDGDVILAAQVLDAGLMPADFVVATTNVAHLSQFVPAELWSALWSAI